MSSSPCPCKSGLPFGACCEPFLTGSAMPQTAEQLMRSRYSAFAKGKISYLKETLWPKFQPEFDFATTAKWAADNHWTGLSVMKCERGEPTDRDGTVLFEAKYLAGGALKTHRELSHFRKKSGRWYYVEALPEE
ncbi:conserved hypothetical protein [Roseibium sp. TrichSKD4]|uniref:YchJ family protein n=1 Tax=Roseibium sp. TrichSKD4 TaxID=744980 RepID=UPI0001E56CBB|nr:YchJ family metal-binding protein [Roseibium sp. TrichSKD4]EFO32705.1 conserved hypothetical protein [Roseibium sp. TrichSKD4]